MTKNRVAIVDPYSSGSLLAAEFRRRGNECVMVQSSADLPAIYRSTLRKASFREVCQHRGDLGTTAEKLRNWGVCCVLPGCELGVTLSDQLSERLELHSNGSQLAAARRNKFIMMEVLRRSGLRAPAQICSSNLSTIMEWTRDWGGWPLIAKPPESTASDRVHLCRSPDELERAYWRILNQENVLGSMNESVLVQEFLRGTEYAVDSVSCGGRHRVAAFWKYHKPSAAPFFVGYDGMELLAPRGRIQSKLWAYVTSALDALGIKYGPAHCEVMWSSGAPVMVEMGARMNGGKTPLLTRACSGTSQIDMTVDAYLDPGRFLDRGTQSYELSKWAVLVFLVPPRPGRVKAFPRLSEIEHLPSFHEMQTSARPGRQAGRPVGWVALIHSERNTVAADVDRIRELERKGLYELEADCADE